VRYKLLKYRELVDNFSNVIDLKDGIYKCCEETGKSTYFYYVKLASGAKTKDYVLVSRNIEDDGFAQKALERVGESAVGDEIIVCPMPQNGYYFSSIILAPSTFHSYFKGILDKSREDLVLCLPIHRCEFSGRESAAEFIEMRRQIPDLDWRRAVYPKIKLRFSNPVTQGGTGGSEVVVSYSILLDEIENLNGVSLGFVEIVNYKDEVLEIISPSSNVFVLIRNRDDNTRESVQKNAVFEFVQSFIFD